MSPSGGAGTWPGPAGPCVAGSLPQRAVHGLLYLHDVEGLADVVEGARAHGLDRRLQGAEAADEHDLDPRVRLLEGAQEVEAGEVRVQVDVGEHDVEAHALGEGERVLGRVRARDLASVAAEELLHEAAGLAVVVDDEDPRHGAARGHHRVCGWVRRRHARWAGAP
jgi:hypothetical protein